MKTLGFNVSKGRVSYCVVQGPKKSATLVSRDNEKFDSEQSLPNLANYFKQTFAEIIRKQSPDVVAYRMSLDALKASIPYLHFSFGILNLIAYEAEISLVQTISATFSTKALLGNKGDKFSVCDTIISGIPADKWNNDYRYAALAAWFALDG